MQRFRMQAVLKEGYFSSTFVLVFLIFFFSPHRSIHTEEEKEKKRFTEDI